MFVIAVFAGIAAVNIVDYDPAGELQDYSEDFFAQLSFGADEALFTGEHVGLVPQLKERTNTSQLKDLWELAWYRWRDDEWQEITDIEPLSPPDVIQFVIELDEEPLDLWEWLEFEEPTPALIFYGGGEALEATVILEIDPARADGIDFESRTQHMDINGLGQVIWRERKEREDREAEFGR